MSATEAAEDDPQQQLLQATVHGLHAALQALNQEDEARAKSQQLTEFCQLMADKQLPVAARLFVLKQKVLAVSELDTKDQALIDAAESATMLGFTVKCLKEFIQSCREGSHSYNYPEPQQQPQQQLQSQGCSTVRAGDSGTGSTVASRRQQPPPLPERRSSMMKPGCSGCSSCSCHNSNNSNGNYNGGMKDRLSTDTGYTSGVSVQADVVESQQQQPQQQPRQRSFSVQNGQSGAAAAAAADAAAAATAKAATTGRGHRTSDPGVKPLKSPGKKGSLLQLLIFPDRAASQKKKAAAAAERSKLQQQQQYHATAGRQDHCNSVDTSHSCEYTTRP